MCVGTREDVMLANFFDAIHLPLLSRLSHFLSEETKENFFLDL